MTEDRKIAIIGNFALDKQQSMLRFASLLEKGYQERNIATQILQPKSVFTSLLPKYKYSGIPKLIGYIDKFILYPKSLSRIARSLSPDTLFHIADHSNAIYANSLPLDRTFLTCHDLLQIKSAFFPHPQNPISASGIKYQKWIARGLESLKYVVCISSKTLEDYQQIVKSHPSQCIQTILQCVNSHFVPLKDEISDQDLSLLGLSKDEDFILHVGGNQWYKNRKGVIEIFAALQQRGFPVKKLVMAGKPLTSEHKALIKKLNLSQQISNPVEITHAQLLMLYSHAQALLFPSIQEGFGWPLIEALSCSCPVITSDKNPMKEIALDAGIYINEANTEQSADQIISTWHDRKVIAKRFESRIDFFGPDRFFQEYQQFTDKIIQNLNPSPTPT